jgi:hypothetical protein
VKLWNFSRLPNRIKQELFQYRYRFDRNRTHKNIEILKKFDTVRSNKFELIRFNSIQFGSIFQENSGVSLYIFRKIFDNYAFKNSLTKRTNVTKKKLIFFGPKNINVDNKQRKFSEHLFMKTTPQKL